ncbi:GNAT family N-acetyltransferase [Sphingomicrobium aestuariivivum]|uniref:GNAT family N-acetyltransferase n=1 Tax=Sphingomicrobium aestuariivivum TaxID=1582356 RepID=UPI001FD6B493|nr:GNAT family N-acetyltransferase [Sphingomicrobium aestuariivivum]MCJ8191969.1 GNAT family N-acetyltransferase [Sphingomicrobium aestuariivivum]
MIDAGDLTVDVVRGAGPWTQALNDLGRHDFFHTFDFHRASQGEGEGDPVALVARVAGKAAGFWPMLERAIEGSDATDLVSVYGYAGPLFAEDVDSGQVVTAMREAWARTGAVSLFSRMHPLFVDQLESDLRGKPSGEVVVINVSSDDTPPSGYRGSHRREINKLVEQGVTVDRRTDTEALALFVDIYHEQMNALGAGARYYFGEPFYKAMMATRDFHTDIFLASLDGEPAAAAMFVTTGDVMQYFLSGTRTAHRKLATNKLLIARAHERAIETGVTRIVLGGGVGGEKDALFKFKAGFSKSTAPFHLVREVLDTEAYARLCDERGIDAAATSFFPAYRVPTC